MYAVILVGGFGTRLRPLTNEVPKPMLPVGNVPMIVSLVERVAEAGVTDVVLALGYQPDPFAAAFPNGRHGDVRVHYAVEPEPLDTGGAIGFAAAAANVTGTFLVLNGDNICDVDYSALVDEHRSRGRLATIHLTPVEDPSMYGVVETDDAGVVRRFVEKPAPGETDSNQISSGAYVLEPAVLDMIESGRRVSVEREVFPRLVELEQLDAITTDDYWTDTGRPETFLAANLVLLDGVRARSVEPIDPSAQVDPSATVIHSVVGPACVVEANASVTDSVLLPGSIVRSGATVTSSIVAGTVESNASVDDCVIGATATVNGSLRSERVPAPQD